MTVGYKRRQMRACAVIGSAVRTGRLPSLKNGLTPCVDCGAPASDYEHRDYDKPHDVEPVCRRCNIRRGRAKWDPVLDPDAPRSPVALSPDEMETCATHPDVHLVYFCASCRGAKGGRAMTPARLEALKAAREAKRKKRET